MSIPDYQSVMMPLLKRIADRQEHSLPVMIEALAGDFKLTDAERRELLPSGGQNRVGWARTYMKKAGLLFTPKRGILQITDRGLQVLKDNPNRVDNKVLRQFPEFLEFQRAKDELTAEVESTATAERLDPQENIEVGYQRIRKELSVELLTRIKACSPLLLRAVGGRAITQNGVWWITARLRTGNRKARRRRHRCRDQRTQAWA